MSVISLDAQQIESLNQEIIALDNSLIKNNLPELESELNAINSNVKGDEINPIINTILSQYQSVKSSLSTEMPKLEAFLEQQLKSYTQTEEELETELTSVMNRMVALSDRVNGGNGTTPSGNRGSNSEDIPGTPGPESKEDPNVKENDNNVYGAIASGALSGAAAGAAIGTFICPLIGTGYGAAVGAAVGAAAPVAVDLIGKAAWGLGEVVSSVGQWAEGLYQW